MSVKLLVMDVDGTLTDGKVYIGDQGELMKAFCVRDGYAIAHMLPAMGITPVIITGRTSEIVKRRAAELKITEIHQGVADKLACLKSILETRAISGQEAAYIGDDLNDLECIRFCGVTACPNDAAGQVKAAVDYICTHNGGSGAVREFIEYLEA